MRQNSGPRATAEQHVRDIRRATRKKYATEDKIRVVLSGLRGEYSIAELCRRDAAAANRSCDVVRQIGCDRVPGS